MASARYDLNQLLHDCRSARLRMMPLVGDTLVSAGCAGNWYFDWIEQRLGRTETHIGIEYYTPRPDTLPDNVRWIENTVGDMNAIPDASCDTVLSGQNLEHLWPEEVVGFFAEAWRVLRSGGLLEVDSPNRLVTEPLCWSHPEHTVELTPNEARRLATLSGFDVAGLWGLWLCADPQTDAIWTLDPASSIADWTIPERIQLAERDPDRSFIWWLEARKAQRQPDVAAMTRLMTSIFDTAWPERTSRFLNAIGRRETEAGETWVQVGADESGAAVYGPYMPLRAGRYRSTTRIRATQARGGSKVRIDVVGDGGREIVVQELTVAELEARDGQVVCEFDLSELEFGMQARVFSPGGVEMAVRLPVAIEVIG